MIRNRPEITCRSGGLAHHVVARSLDLATERTEGLPYGARRETFGPADGGVGRPAPNKIIEQRLAELGYLE